MNRSSKFIYFYYLINPHFQGINRLFALLFKTNLHRLKDFPNVETKD